jgi:hypothetical protein
MIPAENKDLQDSLLPSRGGWIKNCLPWPDESKLNAAVWLCQRKIFHVPTKFLDFMPDPKRKSYQHLKL